GLCSAELYRRVGRNNDADELLWQTFERAPSIEVYRSLMSASGSGKAAVNAVMDRAIATLRAKLDVPAAGARWSAPRELLLEIFISDGRLTEAWEIVRSHGCSEP